MSNYPWGANTNANPYQNQNKYVYTGVQPIDAQFSSASYPDRVQPAEADVTVSTVSDLYTALGNATDGQTIWVADGDYDITGQTRRRNLPANATLAGDGARIYAPGGMNGFLALTNDGARVTGLRFEGDQAAGSYTTQTIAILARANVQIDNCEFYNWQTSAVYVGWPTDTPTRHVTPRIRHSVFRDCRTSGYGYGVACYSGDPMIEYNFLNNNRHSIAASGGSESSYQAHNNLFGTDASSALVMEQHTPGGKRIDIRHNETQIQQTPAGNWARSYAQRGTPSQVANFYNNWTHNPYPPEDTEPLNDYSSLVQYDHGSTTWVNVEWGNNHHGTSKPSDSTIGVQELGYITEQVSGYGTGGYTTGPYGDVESAPAPEPTDEAIPDAVVTLHRKK